MNSISHRTIQSAHAKGERKLRRLRIWISQKVRRLLYALLASSGDDFIAQEAFNLFQRRERERVETPFAVNTIICHVEWMQTLSGKVHCVWQNDNLFVCHFRTTVTFKQLESFIYLITMSNLLSAAEHFLSFINELVTKKMNAKSWARHFCGQI